MSQLVLLTGISGYIAKHIALELLQSGYRVRGTLRDLSREEALRETLTRAGADVSALELREADLGRDEGWAELCEGVDLLMHVASPFPLQQPKGRMDLVPEAREGALRVLKAAQAAGVGRMVMTSSMVAMMYRPDLPKKFVVKESDWSDADWEALSPYIVSKTLAEQVAWDWAEAEGLKDQLCVINPGFVLGPALDQKQATSTDVIKLFFQGAYPALPPVNFPIVDVRDLAQLHVKGLELEELGGRRLMACGETVSMTQMCRMLKEAFPVEGKKIPTGTLPAFAVRLLALFDRSLKTILADLHQWPQGDSAYVCELSGVSFRPAKETILATGQSLIDLGELGETKA